jgi:hypothetical protein
MAPEKVFLVAVRSAGVIVISVLAAFLAAALPVPEKLSPHPKFIYRQIGGGYTLALEKDRQPKTFFLCEPNKTNCISTTEIGWRKPFIIYRNGDLMRASYSVVDTATMKRSDLDQYLKTVPRYSVGVAWDKLSPIRPLW